VTSKDRGVFGSGYQHPPSTFFGSLRALVVREDKNLVQAVVLHGWLACNSILECLGGSAWQTMLDARTWIAIESLYPSAVEGRWEDTVLAIEFTGIPRL